MLANLSVINVLTESHRSGRGNRSALTSTGTSSHVDRWQLSHRKKKRQNRPAYSCELVFINYCCSSFNIPIASSSHIRCYCDPNAYFCVVEIIVDMIFEPRPPPPPPCSQSSLVVFRFLLSVFGWVLKKNVVQVILFLLSCEFSLTLCIWLCMCVRVSDCVVL